MGPDPPRKSLCGALFSLPAKLDVTARCSSSAACPARITAVSLSLATCFSPWRPGHTTTRGTPAGVSLEGLHGGSRWRVSMEGLREGFSWRVSVEGFPGASPWRVSMEGLRGRSPWRVSMEGLRGGSP